MASWIRTRRSKMHEIRHMWRKNGVSWNFHISLLCSRCYNNTCILTLKHTMQKKSSLASTSQALRPRCHLLWCVLMTGSQSQMAPKLKSNRAKVLLKNMTSAGLASTLVRAIQQSLYSNRLRLYLHTYLLSVLVLITYLRMLIYMESRREFLLEGPWKITWTQI